jgi:type IV pilus assembly protein PilC
MALFSYKAINSRGKAMLGQIEAINLIDLELRLQRMGLDLIVGAPSRKRASLFKGAIGRQDLINFCFHLEQLATAGVPVLESLSDLRDSAENPRFREVMSGLIESIQGGQGLSAAMADYPEVFSKVFASLIRTGEDTGRMSEVLKSLAENLKWEDEIVAQTRKMMMYPLFVGGIVVAVTFFLMIYLVPQMISFIKASGQKIPLHTRALIEVSNFIIHYWWAVLMAPVLAYAGLKLAAARSPHFRYQVDNAKLHIPMIGTILRKIILSRFASTFAMMYASGITILDCIKSSEEGAGNLVVKEGLALAGQQIAEGKNVSNAFQDVGLFPPLVIRMLRVGESTGNLDNALLNVSYFYNRDVKDAIGKVQVMIEPAMTVILGVLLGWVMLSVLGPIYDSISKIKF